MGDILRLVYYSLFLFIYNLTPPAIGKLLQTIPCNRQTILQTKVGLWYFILVYMQAQTMVCLLR